MPQRSAYSTPRWVKVFAIIVIVLVLLAVVVLVTGLGGPHGPGRHIPLGNAGDTPLFRVTEDYTPSGGTHTPSSSVTEHGGQQP